MFDKENIVKNNVIAIVKISVCFFEVLSEITEKCLIPKMNIPIIDSNSNPYINFHKIPTTPWHSVRLNACVLNVEGNRTKIVKNIDDSKYLNQIGISFLFKNTYEKYIEKIKINISNSDVSWAEKWTIAIGAAIHCTKILRTHIKKETAIAKNSLLEIENLSLNNIYNAKKSDRTIIGIYE